MANLGFSYIRSATADILSALTLASTKTQISPEWMKGYCQAQSSPSLAGLS